MGSLYKVRQLPPSFLLLVSGTWAQMGSIFYKHHCYTKDISGKFGKSTKYRGALLVSIELAKLRRILECEFDNEWFVISRSGMIDLLVGQAGKLPSGDVWLVYFSTGPTLITGDGVTLALLIVSSK